ncbi:MAG: anhydro-N-acetylmuramic acid kinase [Undibacterium sp.]|uniref:anhydro-N-acetylmuramic acid kinase n=1 Tax=Undibacterium sp. TaxID=1914977 RepID=UPI00271A180C|nr:anhydro-N-acetylmuramic acid kinase [Undibacterium sp.]MDO8651452.1 anhydro-N-acetylmuramic acid kinase [Undibacterium sp.]
MNSSNNHLYIGLMSGTSLDGVDGVLVDLPQDGAAMRLLASAYQPFSAALRSEAMALQQPGENEIEREAQLANHLAENYAACVAALLQAHPQAQVRAIGVHGQTIRHRPELGYTRQTNNPALLAELCGIDVIADFRSRDVAAGGQGAPLVPAFHRAVFGAPEACRVVVNIGGISNISILHADGRTTGFDTGPGNVLMDAWIARHQGSSYDENGTWASQGRVQPDLLAAFCDEAFLQLTPPKSTGRDLFRPDWLAAKLSAFAAVSAVDVQATLCAFTAVTLADAISRYAPDVSAVSICGGGAYNATLMRALSIALQARDCAASVDSTARLDVSPSHVEALAFAWLAQRFTLRLPGNLPEVTGAEGLRILGALYPA